MRREAMEQFEETAESTSSARGRSRAWPKNSALHRRMVREAIASGTSSLLPRSARNGSLLECTPISTSRTGLTTRS